jgi:hypothetical protein
LGARRDAHPERGRLRYLVFTTLAYGAQAISYYVYAHPGHEGSIASLDGTPGPLYHALKTYNREFVAIAKELQPLRSLAMQHTAMRETGCEPLPADAAFRLEETKSSAHPRGFLLGSFGMTNKASHVVVVNLDYTKPAKATLTGPGSLETFDPLTSQWKPLNKSDEQLNFPPGGGRLVRAVRRSDD